MASNNKTLSVTIPGELVDAIKELAARERRNLGQQTTILLESAMRLRGPKNRAILGAPPMIEGGAEADDAAA